MTRLWLPFLLFGHGAAGKARSAQERRALIPPEGPNGNSRRGRTPVGPNATRAAALLARSPGGKSWQDVVGKGHNFVIFSRPRSGTTWLAEMLNAHPEISCDFELMLRLKNDEQLERFYREFKRTGALHAEYKKRDRKKLQVKAQGFKWFPSEAGINLFPAYYQLRQDPATKAANRKRMEGWAKFLKDGNFRVIHLDRTHRLARVLSQARLLAVSESKCTGEPCLQRLHNHKVELKAARLAEVLQDDEKSGMDTLKWLTTNGLPKNRILYASFEDLVKDTRRVLYRMFQFIGVAPHPVPMKNATFAGSRKPLSEQISNLKQVRRALEGTKYLKDLDVPESEV